MNALVKSMLNRLRYAFLPPAGVGICRVRHDRECARIRGNGRYPYLSRFYDAKIKQPRALPETVRFNGGRGTVSLARPWQNFFDGWNTPAAEQYLKRKQSGWVNYGPWPKIEQLCTASVEGTFVVVTHKIGRKCYIASYSNDKTPLDYPDIDYLQRFGVVSTDDSIDGPPCGTAYTFAIANPGEQLWMNQDDLTFVRSA
jgi:hypothetical protein